MRISSILFFVVCFFITLPAQASWSEDFIAGSEEAFTGTNKYIWYTGGALTVIAFNFDTQIFKHFEGKKHFRLADDVGDNMGTGVPGAALALLTLGVGHLQENDRLLLAGKSHAQALIATFAYTSLIKALIERDRPPNFTTHESIFNASFPSGHTSTAFATAGSVMASAGPLAGVPFLALAALTGYSRLQQGAHYLGDVLFAATLGYTMGTGFYNHNSKSRVAKNLRIVPLVDDRESWGFLAQYNF